MSLEHNSRGEGAYRFYRALGRSMSSVRTTKKEATVSRTRIITTDRSKMLIPDPDNNSRLETLADELEGIARTQQNDLAKKMLFATAWDIKRIARAGTASEGV